MHKEGFYSSGEFAKKANVTVRTIRYYDKQDILKPSYLTGSGARFYTDSDFTRLQQILLLKYLGFSLEEIKNMTIGASDYNILINSLHLQLKLIQDKIAQMQLVKNAIEETTYEIEKNKSVDWSNMLSLIHLTNMENSLNMQYQNAGNISARIKLHSMFSVNRQGWFNWIYDICNVHAKMKILELGCGGGQLWSDNKESLQRAAEGGNINIIVTDISEGMVNDAKRNIGNIEGVRFNYDVVDCEDIPYNDNEFDLVIANHVLFYCEDINKSLVEINRVLKPKGRLVCATYGAEHMQEINWLVQDFDKRIVLAADRLYDKFGLENGRDILSSYFTNIEKKLYDDYLMVDKSEPLIEYILSCHGNQNQYLLNRYSDFKAFINKKLSKPMRITKEAGVFNCEK